eukprot:365535-Chlamydomonas_euryale.AAC.57
MVSSACAAEWGNVVTGDQPYSQLPEPTKSALRVWASILSDASRIDDDTQPGEGILARVFAFVLLYQILQRLRRCFCTKWAAAVAAPGSNALQSDVGQATGLPRRRATATSSMPPKQNKIMKEADRALVCCSR